MGLFSYFGTVNLPVRNDENRGYLYSRLIYHKEIKKIWFEGVEWEVETGTQMENGVEIEISRPGYDSDTDKGVDLLGITNEVKALSRLIASKDIIPPLSVGLFGDWGSGKSFFMKTLEQEVEDISERVQDTDEETGYCKNKDEPKE